MIAYVLLYKKRKNRFIQIFRWENLRYIISSKISNSNLLPYLLVVRFVRRLHTHLLFAVRTVIRRPIYHE